MIIYHTEFLSLEAIASLYIEAHRILRRQLPSTSEDGLAHDTILHLHVMLGSDYFEFCASDPIISGWLGQQANPPGLLGAFGLSAPPAAQLNLALLERRERKKMQKLTMKAYGMSPPPTGVQSLLLHHLFTVVQADQRPPAAQAGWLADQAIH